MIAIVVILAAILPYIAGDTCENTQCPENASCVELYGCQCTGDLVLASDLTRCLNVAYDGYGVACEDNAQCSARLQAGGVCKDSCQCKSGYHYLHGQCWKTSGLGAVCNRDEDCFAYSDYDSMTCKDGVCACGERAYNRNPFTCRRSAHVGEACDLDDDCESTATCSSNNICQLQGHTQATVQWRPSSGPVLEPNASDCSGNKTESTPGGACVCKKGFFRTKAGGECLPELGEFCEDTTDCAPLTEVVCRQSASRDNKTCACSGGYMPSSSNRECVKTRRYGFNCVEDAQCSYYGGVCVSEGERLMCQCPQGYRYLDDDIICWPTRALGEACSDPRDCMVASGEGVDCKNGQCQCVEGYHTTSQQNCWRDAEGFGSACKEKGDCPFGTGAICNNDGVCDCDREYFQSEPGTTPSCFAGVGATCESDKTCSALLNSTCHTECMELIPGYPCMNVSTCICPQGHVASENLTSCLPVATSLGDNCMEKLQCEPTLGPNSACPDGHCVCAQDHHFRSGRCWETRFLGQRCNKTSECFLEEDISRSVCMNQVCECSFDWIKSPDSDKCQSVPGEGVHTTAAVTIFSLVFWTLLARMMLPTLT